MPVQNGKLKPDDEARIRQNYSKLREELDGKHFVADLFSENVFTLDDKEEIDNLSTRLKRTEKMLDKLILSGPGNAYDVFMKILERDSPHLAEKVKNTTVVAVNSESAYSWYSDIPDETKKHVLTDADASRYSGCFGNNWQTIIMRLGVPNATIQQEQQRSPGNVVGIITNLLIKWKQRVFKKATVSALLEVLKEVDQEGASTINWELVRNITMQKIEA